MMDVTGGIGRGRLKTKIFIIVGVVLFLGAAAAAGFFYMQYNKLRNDPKAVSEETITRLTREVGAIYQLPDEKPTIAQVEDKEKLKDQQFFTKAQNGDYILIYTNAKLALLYREKDRKLINVGPITISDTSQAQPQGQQPPQTPAPNDQQNQDQEDNQ